MTKSEKKFPFKIIISLLIVTISITLFLISYFYFINKTHGKYENSMISNIDIINGINNNMDTFIEKENIKLEKSKEKLPNFIDELIDVRNNIKLLKPSQNLNNNYTYLVDGLENNILIYKQILAILNNPNAKDIEIAIENLKEYRNSSMNNYALLNIENTKITLPTSCLTLIDNTIYFGYKSVRHRKDTEIKNSQTTDFINKIEELYTNFLTLKTDFYVHLPNKRDGNYDNLIKRIDDNKEKLNKIQDTFKNTPIPSEGITIYETFKSLIDEYDLYIQSFKFALINEKAQISQTTTTNKNSLNSLYTSSNDKYKNIDSLYNEFIKNFKIFKDKYSK